jgi:hypothetical protein
MRFCDKCGKPVDPTNDAVELDIELHRAEGDLFPIGLVIAQARHLLPVAGCPGSPSRAQYLEGQPRDPRGIYGYDPEHEEPIRKAYASMRDAAREGVAYEA